MAKIKVIHLAETVSLNHSGQDKKTKLSSRFKDSSMRVNNTEPKLCKQYSFLITCVQMLKSSAIRSEQKMSQTYKNIKELKPHWFQRL